MSRCALKILRNDFHRRGKIRRHSHTDISRQGVMRPQKRNHATRQTFQPRGIHRDFRYATIRNWNLYAILHMNSDIPHHFFCHDNQDT
jgi:hypothetical protein